MHHSNGTLDLVTGNSAFPRQICVSRTRQQLCIFPRLKLVVCFWFYRLFQCIFTRAASIELHSHGNVTVPSPRVNTDIASSDGGNQRIRLHCVSVAVSTKILENQRENNSLPGYLDDYHNRITELLWYHYLSTTIGFMKGFWDPHIMKNLQNLTLVGIQSTKFCTVAALPWKNPSDKTNHSLKFI